MSYPHAIRDPIHGYVRLTAAEIRGIDTPEMQRLRGISQLGLTERVYPGARHSRFEHAIGALEVVTRILEELRGRLGVAGVLRPLGIPPRSREYERLLETAR
ncbi:MAG: HD domain-containing protein, partial [Planctomycetota bacterium]